MQHTYSSHHEPEILSSDNKRPDYILPFCDDVEVSKIEKLHWKFGDIHTLDFFVPEGSEVCAARSGRVVGINSLVIGGAVVYESPNSVFVRHDDETFAKYQNLDRGLYVEIGDQVMQGQAIGYVAQHGCGKGPTLHLTLFTLFKGKIMTIDEFFPKPPIKIGTWKYDDSEDDKILEMIDELLEELHSTSHNNHDHKEHSEVTDYNEAPQEDATENSDAVANDESAQESTSDTE